MKYYSINEFSKILGVSAQTLRNWDKNGKLHPHHTSSNGYRYYSHEQLNQVLNKEYKQLDNEFDDLFVNAIISTLSIYKGKVSNSMIKKIESIEGVIRGDKDNQSNANPK